MCINRAVGGGFGVHTVVISRSLLQSCVLIELWVVGLVCIQSLFQDHYYNHVY